MQVNACDYNFTSRFQTVDFLPKRAGKIVQITTVAETPVWKSQTAVNLAGHIEDGNDSRSSTNNSTMSVMCTENIIVLKCKLRACSVCLLTALPAHITLPLHIINKMK